MSTVRPITHPALEGSPIVHGFFSREGGVSGGVYAGLNCGPGSNDDPENVVANRKLAMAAMAGEADSDVLLTCYQIHSPDVITVKAPWPGYPDGPLPKADAMVTNVPGLALGILTADCVPVLLVDKNNSVIGALHAGWKGAIAGVVENTVGAMAALGANPDNIIAVIGPAICQQSYEVGIDVKSAVNEKKYFRPSTRPDHWMFDLPGYVADKLKSAGVGVCENIDHDTYSDEKRFFSYRRTTHREESDYGRILSAIMISK